MHWSEKVCAVQMSYLIERGYQAHVLALSNILLADELGLALCASSLQRPGNMIILSCDAQ